MSSGVEILSLADFEELRDRGELPAEARVLATQAEIEDMIRDRLAADGELARGVGDWFSFRWTANKPAQQPEKPPEAVQTRPPPEKPATGQESALNAELDAEAAADGEMLPDQPGEPPAFDLT